MERSNYITFVHDTRWQMCMPVGFSFLCRISYGQRNMRAFQKRTFCSHVFWLLKQSHPTWKMAPVLQDKGSEGQLECWPMMLWIFSLYLCIILLEHCYILKGKSCFLHVQVISCSKYPNNFVPKWIRRYYTDSAMAYCANKSLKSSPIIRLWQLVTSY